MGNRANILVKEDESDGGVYLYTHSGADELPTDLQNALIKQERWSDCQYLTRIIFDTMTQGMQGSGIGFGISSLCGDGSNRILEVNVDKNSVSYEGKIWSFEEYIKLNSDELESVWVR